MNKLSQAVEKFIKATGWRGCLALVGKGIIISLLCTSYSCVRGIRKKSYNDERNYNKIIILTAVFCQFLPHDSST